MPSRPRPQLDPRAAGALGNRWSREVDPAIKKARAANRKILDRDTALLKRLRKRLDKTWLDVYTEFDDQALVETLRQPVKALQDALDRAYEAVGAKHIPTRGPSGLTPSRKTSVKYAPRKRR